MEFAALEYVYLSLASLRRVLNDLDGNHGRWWLEDPVVMHRRDLPRNITGMVEVFHAKGGLNQVTDELSFLIPVVSPSHQEDECDTFVWLEPEFIEPGIERLYLENGRVFTDFIQDCNRFWVPLRKAVCQTTLQTGP
jgi:hypothetical protein